MIGLGLHFLCPETYYNGSQTRTLRTDSQQLAEPLLHPAHDSCLLEQCRMIWLRGADGVELGASGSTSIGERIGLNLMTPPRVEFPQLDGHCYRSPVVLVDAPGITAGELIFSSDFEGGNLAAVRMASDYEYELTLQHDSINPK